MAQAERPDHLAVYDAVAEDWDAGRTEVGAEGPWLGRLLDVLPRKARVLDVGCGSGRPIAAAMLAAGHRVTGLDFAPAMIDLARRWFPQGDWRLADMRKLDLRGGFDAVIAWDSFFHLTPDEQRAVLPRLATALEPGGWLLFTSGPAAGEAWGQVAGRDVWHASLDPDDYRIACARVGLPAMTFVPQDPLAGGHSVWFGQKTL